MLNAPTLSFEELAQKATTAPWDNGLGRRYFAWYRTEYSHRAVADAIPNLISVYVSDHWDNVEMPPWRP